MIDQLYFKKMMKTRKSMGNQVWAPLAVLAFILIYALTSPQNYTQTGFLFFYPLYSDYSIQCLYTTGTWFWIFVITWLMQSFANKKFSDTGYKVFAGSSLYAYVSHYFFIIMIAVLLIRPYKIPFMQALVLEVALTNAIILLSYWAFITMYECVFPPKMQQEKLDGDEVERMGLLKNQEINVEAKAR
jgi:hypothetical protein